MSDMGYEKAWKGLKGRIEILSGVPFLLVEFEDINDDLSLLAQGAEAMGRKILDIMDKLEKEMTTAGQDDGQSAQD